VKIPILEQISESAVQLSYFVIFIILCPLTPAPAHHSFAVPSGKPREMFQFDKKSAKVYHSSYSSTEQLQVALRTYIFLWLGLNNEKSLHTLPLRSVSFLSLHL
jgi:hypothetical protein